MISVQKGGWFITVRSKLMHANCCESHLFYTFISLYTAICAGTIETVTIKVEKNKRQEILCIKYFFLRKIKIDVIVFADNFLFYPAKGAKMTNVGLFVVFYMKSIVTKTTVYEREQIINR